MARASLGLDQASPLQGQRKGQSGCGRGGLVQLLVKSGRGKYSKGWNSKTDIFSKGICVFLFFPALQNLQNSMLSSITPNLFSRIQPISLSRFLCHELTPCIGTWAPECFVLRFPLHSSTAS